jgi:hypothetical protein
MTDDTLLFDKTVPIGFVDILQESSPLTRVGRVLG